MVSETYLPGQMNTFDLFTVISFTIVFTLEANGIVSINFHVAKQYLRTFRCFLGRRIELWLPEIISKDG